MSRDAGLLIAGGAVLVLLSCDKEPATGPGEPTPLTVSRVEIAPATDTLGALGQRRQFTATAKDARGNTISGKVFTWLSSDSAVASVDARGLATARGNGTATIRANADNVTGTATLVVRQIATRLAFTQQPGNTVAGTAISPAVQVTLRDLRGNPVVTATDSVTVSLAANPKGATLSGTATVAAAAGVAAFSDLKVDSAGTGYTLQARSGALPPDTSAAFDILPAVTVRPLDSFLFVGDSVQLRAIDAQGQPIPDDRIRWSSSDERVALVDGAGKVRARGEGRTTITATVGTSSSSASVKVNRTASVDRRINSETSYRHQEEPFLVVDGQGRLFAGWKEMNLPAGVNRVAFAYSLDGGVSWSPAAFMENHPQVQSMEGQSDPWLAVDRSGHLYFSRLEDGLKRVVVSRSDDAGLTWSTPVDARERDPRVLFGLQRVDKPSLLADGDGRLFIAYHGEFSATAPVNVGVQWSTDGGASWSPSVRMDSIPTLLGTAGQAPVLAAASDGTLYGAWWSRPVGAGNANGNIVVAASRDRGATWSGGVRVNPIPGSVPLRPDPGFCCRLPFPSLVISPRGRVLVAWPDWSGDWDALVSWSDDGGASWAAPVRISDVKQGDQWMVALAVDSTGTLHAAWYDSRSGDINLVYARSTDEGGTWSPNLRANTRTTPGPVTRLGDYIGITVRADGTVYFAWTDGRDQDLDIYFARSTDF